MYKQFNEVLTPAYGRDYKSKARLVEDFNEEKDFMCNPSMRYINKPQLDELCTSVQVRYDRNRKVAILKKGKNGVWL